MKILGIITARSGSKGIPDKNIRMVAGKPLMAWTIQEANRSSMLDRVIVSTDSLKYADIAKQHGGDVPFLRPKELSQDDTPHYVVILDALNRLGIKTYTHCCILQPTSPLRNVGDIDSACMLSIKLDCSVVTVTANREYPFLFKRDKKGRLKFPMFRLNKYLPRQKIEPKYHVNGAIFVFPIDKFLEEKTIYCGKVYGIEMPKERSIQIDDEFDIDIAEYLLLSNQVSLNIDTTKSVSAGPIIQKDILIK